MKSLPLLALIILGLFFIMFSHAGYQDGFKDGKASQEFLIYTDIHRICLEGYDHITFEDKYGNATGTSYKVTCEPNP